MGGPQAKYPIKLIVEVFKAYWGSNWERFLTRQEDASKSTIMLGGKGFILFILKISSSEKSVRLPVQYSLFSLSVTEKSDSIVLAPGNTEANPPYNCFNLGSFVPRIPHLPSKMSTQTGKLSVFIIESIHLLFIKCFHYSRLL